MHQFLESDFAYVFRLEEILWGALLLGITLFIHGIALFQITRGMSVLLGRTDHTRSAYESMGILILAAWVIVVINLVEIAIWAGFFVWKEAQPNAFISFYNAILNYTTLQAGYLPVRWRLLEGLLGMAGLMTAWWSTSIWFSFADQLMHESLAREREKRRSRSSAKRDHE